MSNKNTGRGVNGKGYYIALVLCAAAIGITGYLYYQNTDREALSGTEPAALAGADTVPQLLAEEPTAPAATQPSTEPRITGPVRTASPVQGQTVAAYAMDALGYNATTRDWRAHNGVDIAAEAGTQVCAAADGTVYTTYEDDAMGTTVVIRHDGGYTTVYASLDPQLAVAAGDAVSLGDPIGTVGTSALLESAIGDHVHFSVTLNGESIDPAEFFSIGS